MSCPQGKILQGIVTSATLAVIAAESAPQNPITKRQLQEACSRFSHSVGDLSTHRKDCPVCAENPADS